MKKYLLLFSIFLITAHLQAQNYKLFIGTYTNKETSKGIYIYKYNGKTAGTKLKTIIETSNPSYLAVHDREFLYSVSEEGEFSAVSAFHLNQKKGAAVKLSFANSKGLDPCYILADQKNIVLANYSSGSISVFERSEKDGSIIGLKQLIQHNGRSIDPKRQASAHVHQVLLTPDKKYIVSTDLGEDRVYIYNYDKESEHEVLTLKTVVETDPGSGPRHLSFSPNGKFVYLVSEFKGTITAYAYADGALSKIQEISTTPQGFKGRIDGADIHVSADGKFLYETNRGDANTISVFEIDSAGMLKHVETIATMGKGPRNFAIDPSGDFLLVAHQYTNEVVIFRRNKTTGTLKDSGKRISVGTPVCLVFSE
jgi:6-phosphogluconolactonase